MKQIVITSALYRHILHEGSIRRRKYNKSSRDPHNAPVQTN